MQKARVIKQHISEFDQPLKLSKGDLVECTEKSTYWKGWIYCPNFNGIDGWIPESILEYRKRNEYVVLQEYYSVEINAEINDEVHILSETSEWAWVKNDAGDRGWIPLENLELM